MVPFIPYGRQSINDEDIEAVVAVLRSEYLTCGPRVEMFEKEFAACVGAKHAVAVSSGTAALHLAMCVAGIKTGDRVVTSPNTFLASANCAAYVGATPDFADIDPVSYNIDPAALEANWKPDTKAVVAVDYAGQSADLPEISRVARARGAIVIEDACHGVGGGFFHHGRIWRLGGNPWADLACFSFHPVKSMTAGEGGMLVTDNDEWAENARHLRSHGIVREPNKFTAPDGCSITAEKGPWYYEMQELGFNYRLTDIHCALGISQLRRLPKFLSRRREIVTRYNEAFTGIEWLKSPKLRNQRDRELSSWHLYTVQIDFSALKNSRSEVMNRLRQSGVGTQVLYIPVHLQPWYRKTYGYVLGKCPVVEEFYTRSLSLPLYPALTDSDVKKVVAEVRGLGDG